MREFVGALIGVTVEHIINDCWLKFATGFFKPLHLLTSAAFGIAGSLIATRSR